jgi:hypothetical protein
VSVLGKYKVSALVALVIAAVLTFTVFNLGLHKKHNVLRHDMYQYYNYLPAVFIYQDLGMGFGALVDEKYGAEIWCVSGPNGNCAPKMTMGVSYLMAPFFGMAHALAQPLGYEANGYSSIYHFMLALGALLYAIASLWLLRWLLLRWFGDGPEAITLASVFLGSNLFFYQAVEGNMAHGYLFFLSVVFLILLWKWNHRPLKQYAFFLGMAGGLITLIRPVDALFFLLIPLWNVSSWKSLKFRLNYLWMKRIHMGMLIFGAALPLLPQFWYWHELTGSWLYYSYAQEGFYWSEPFFLRGLFGFRKGWLIYTPVMIFALIGAWRLLKTKHEAGVAWLAFTLPFIYVIFSWWCWWYGGSYGMRSMVDTYALMAISMAAFLHFLCRAKPMLRFGTWLFIVLFIGLNQFQVAQYRWGILHYDSMTGAAYKAIFLRSTYPPDYEKHIVHPDYEAAGRGERK